MQLKSLSPARSHSPKGSGRGFSASISLVRVIGILGAAICFLIYYAVLIYSELYQPRNFGLVLKPKEEPNADPARASEGAGLVVAKALPNFPAQRAGVAVGDHILHVDGAELRQLADWNRINVSRELGRAYSFTILRGEETREITVTLFPPKGRPVGWFEQKRAVQGVLLLTALILALAKTSNPTALTGALLLAGIGTAPAFPESEMTAIWRNLPAPVGAILWIPQCVHLLLLPLLFTFFAMIPKSLFVTMLGWLIMWTPGGLLAAWTLSRMHQHIYHPGTQEDLPGAFHFACR